MPRVVSARENKERVARMTYKPESKVKTRTSPLAAVAVLGVKVIPPLPTSTAMLAALTIMREAAATMRDLANILTLKAYECEGR